jgi:peptidoglycan/xylan/chitin deacetylase (PgdA/CDA1 family)
LEELRVLAQHPLFEIGGHTMIHPILARALAEVQRNEIFGNRDELETLTGVKIWAFAYPNGRPRLDYSEETLQLVQEAGFEIAFSSRSGFALPSESRWERSRFLMLSGISEAELAHRLAYSWRRPVD